MSTLSAPFATGYGTSFQCSSVCHFITVSCSSLLVLLLVLLFTVPVSTTKYVKPPQSGKRKRVHKPPPALKVAPHLLDPYVPLASNPVATSEGDADSEACNEPRIEATDYDFISSLAAAPRKSSPRRSSVVEKVVAENVKRVNLTRKTDRRAELRSVDVSYETLCDEAIQEHEYLEFVRNMLDGVVLTKLKSNGKKSKRIFTLSPDLLTLQWSKPHGLLHKHAAVAVKDILGVTTGQGPHGMYLTLLQVDNATLDLQAENDVALQKLLNGFSTMLRSLSSRC
ncbi:hypothetical protein ACHHYP_20176 [Achlya hypogyna]|uniref:Uncharacterized protein n=1 Tax=Achlya hypogyna TaxID=1202772 RepID=A0A1V9ZP60_ACHHY|nr:hypothetical protein ACHHYP_20176 [Achlya hypogyna]